MTTHTPGPWKIVGGTEVRGGDRIICNTADYRIPGDTSPAADARLIASAPAMLEALRTIVANASSVQLDPQWAVQVARAAIAAATREVQS